MRKIILFLTLLLLPLSCFTYERTLDICAMFKNEARFLKEWIEYHRLVGVERFWLYNNNSEDNYQEVLQPYIDEGVVFLFQWPSIQLDNDWFHHSFQVQTGAYNHCLSLVNRKTKWLALIDIDEFIVPVTGDSIPAILEGEFSNVSGLCINWVMFGTSNVSEIFPDELLIEKLTRKGYLIPLHYKSIVQPAHVANCPNPHFCNYHSGHWHVNTNRERIEGSIDYSEALNKLKIHHYWTKDEKFFREVKIARYQRWGISPEKMGDLYFKKEQLNTYEDLEMMRFVPRLKERLQLHQSQVPLSPEPES